MQSVLTARAETSGAILVLGAAALSFALSVTLWFTGNHETAIFVGLWVPSILSAASFVRTHTR